LFALTVTHLGYEETPGHLNYNRRCAQLSAPEKEPIVAIRTFQQHTPALGERAFVDRSAVVIGDVEIGADSSVWPLTVIRGDMHRIRIGARTSVQDASVLHITHAGPFNPDGFPLLIGDDVTIGHKVMLHGCTVGSRILIGMGSTVMDGAVVEDEVIIGAGSLVPPGKRLESGFLYVGSPVKQARPLTDKERAFFTYTAGNYVKLKDQHLAEGYHLAD
jgi:carbonic anhydrase/acetyltransferase-like protein (isoleucine patch superfamily)